MTDFAIQRTKMVDGQLRTTDVTNVGILEAMATIPREEFVPPARRALSYMDDDIEVAPGRYIMEPSPFGKLLQLAQIARSDFVLDVGCASGYSSAVISRLCDSVIALESDEETARLAGERLSRLGYDNAVVVSGPLKDGWPSQAPYDVIVVEGAVPAAPETLIGQLRDGGRLVAVVGYGHAGSATVFVKEGERISTRRAFNASIRPLGEFQPQPTFQF